MADEADRAQILEEAERESSVKAAAVDLAKGTPGECTVCGFDFERVINGCCAGCREREAKDAELRRQRNLREEG